MVYDTAGRLVRQLLNGELAAGPQMLEWDGRDSLGRTVSSGRYFFRIRADDVETVRSVTVVR